MPAPPADLLPVTNANVQAAYDFIFAPWVKQLGLCEFDVGPGRASARLPLDAALKFSSGAVCGQAIMAAIDTVVSLAMATGERFSRGTVYQHTHFLRPAVDDDFRIEATVLRFGRSTAFAESRVLFVSTGVLVAHATAEFAF